MALTYRSSTASTAGGSGDALSVTKPSGVADGDILVAAFYWETAANTITPPAGWTLILKETNVNPSPTIQLVAFWKRASSEPASWTFTPGTNGQWRFYVCAAWSGATGSGDQVDVKGSTHGSNNIIAPPSVTTTAATETVLMLQNNWNGNDCTYTSGPCPTKRVGFAGLAIWEGTKSTAGATGAGDYRFGTEDWNAITVAFKDDSGGGGVTGSGGVSFGAPALAASGAETIGGTGATAFGAPALAGSGVETIAASGGVSFGAPSLAAAGTEAIAGTAAVVFGAPSLAGSGGVGDTATGSGAVVFGAPVLAGTGLESIAGVGAVVVGVAGLAGTGLEAITGTGGVTIGAPVVAGTNISSAAGSARSVLGVPSAGAVVRAPTATTLLVEAE
jgi:hypothetical protein